MPKPKNNQKPHLKLHHDHVAFRLLCHHNAGLSIIGRGGATIQKIVKDTGIPILHVENTLPGATERIVYFVGPGKLDKTLVLEDGRERRKFEVSVAQEALFRVLAVVEAEMAAVDERCVRLLTVKGEEKVKSLGGLVCGAVVRVLPMEELPLCADLSDDLIQITGDVLAVQKALLDVTYCLQGNSPQAINQSHGPVSYGVPDLPAQEHLSLADVGDGGQSHVVVGMKKVAFRLLCPAYTAGGLIGFGGSIVQALEKDTGALIQVMDPVVGCDDRVIKVSAMEKKEVQNSPAQDAALRVFIRSLEAAAESGHASGFDGGPVTARLLVSQSQANMLRVEDAVGVEVQILENCCTPAATVGEKVIQIIGEFTEVHICLLQITWALRESMFSIKKNIPLLPHVLYGRPPLKYAAKSIADEMDLLAVSHDNSLSPTIQPLEPSCGHSLTTFIENQGDVMAVASSNSSELGSWDEYGVVKNEVEVDIPEHVFDQLYGEAGRNLALLRQISGATVTVHDPSPGTNGKVIICGTPDQTEIARSVLYAFILGKHDLRN